MKEHPGWFDWRPDGTIKFAENPPKKYEDIVNVDFYAKDAIPDLWVELRDIVEMWVEEGVRLFRVDNPHTKPFPFWEWLIGDIRARHPDVVFLSEAFTRPKVMAIRFQSLARIGARTAAIVSGCSCPARPPSSSLRARPVCIWRLPSSSIRPACLAQSSRSLLPTVCGCAGPTRSS